MIIEQKPSKEFSGLIEKIWMAPRRGGGGDSLFEIMPDGNFDLVFMLGDSCCKLIYTGPFTELRRVRFFDRYEYFCIRFRPGIMPRVADLTAADLVNSWVVLPKVLGTRADQIGERLFTAKGFVTKLRLIEDFFRKANLHSSLPKQHFIGWSHIIEESHGIIRVEDLADQANLTTRSLERTFLEQTGLAPKTFIRMVRFQHVLARLKQGGSYTNLAELACECGYADQSHFIKDFKQLAQRLPSRV